MIKMDRRLDVRLISPDALRQYMKFRDYTIRSLADRVGVSRATIGHLVGPDPKRKTCRPETARAIAKALDCPVDALFVAKLSSVRREVGRAA